MQITQTPAELAGNGMFGGGGAGMISPLTAAVSSYGSLPVARVGIGGAANCPCPALSGSLSGAFQGPTNSGLAPWNQSTGFQTTGSNGAELTLLGLVERVLHRVLESIFNILEEFVAPSPTVSTVQGMFSPVQGSVQESGNKGVLSAVGDSIVDGAKSFMKKLFG